MRAQSLRERASNNAGRASPRACPLDARLVTPSGLGAPRADQRTRSTATAKKEQNDYRAHTVEKRRVRDQSRYKLTKWYSCYDTVQHSVVSVSIGLSLRPVTMG